MKYETPELKALTPAINAIQETSGVDKTSNLRDHISGEMNDSASGAYADWE
jgi:hypothetical protein